MTRRLHGCWQWRGRDSETPDLRAPRRKDASRAPTTPLNWEAARWRVLDVAHRKRNLAEYEGVIDVEESEIKELCALTAELIADVAKLTGSAKPKA